MLQLLGDQLEDGGWNCEAPKSRRSSCHTTICVLEGLFEYERAGRKSTAVTKARKAGRKLSARAPHVPLVSNWQSHRMRSFFFVDVSIFVSIVDCITVS